MNFIRVRHFSPSGDFFLETNINYLYYVGLWPNDNWTKMYRILYKIYEIFLHILSIIFLIITAVGMFRVRNNVPLFLSSLDKSFAAYNFVMKIAMFEFKRDQLKRLIEDIQFSEDEVSKERTKLMRYHVPVIAGICTLIVTAFLGLALLKGEVAIELWLPFDPLKNKMNLLLAAQIIGLTFAPCLYRSFAIQGLVCSLMMYMCDQLKDLQARFRALEYTAETDKAMREEFTAIVKKHVRLIRYSKTTAMLFKELFLIQNLAIQFELCLNAMMVTMVGLEDITLLANFLAFLAAASLNNYIFCYLGDEMMVQSQGLALAAYESPWTSWPLDLQRDLITVIRVAQKPLLMSAGGIANISLQTFARALYNGYSIFAVLNDVVD